MTARSSGSQESESFRAHRGMAALWTSRTDSCSDESLRASLLDEMAILVQNTAVPRNDSAPALGLRAERLYFRKNVNRITEENRPMKLPVEDRQQGEGIDRW